jgi:putative membrane protein
VAQLLLSLSQLAVALLMSAIAAYLAFYLFQLFTRDLDEWQALRQGNAAVGLVLGAMLVSVAIVLRPAIVVSPSVWDVGRAFFFRVLLAQALQLVVGLVLAVLALAVALYLFTALTRDIDEVEELRKGNLAIAGLLAGVVIGVGLMVAQAVGQVMGWVASLVF